MKNNSSEYFEKENAHESRQQIIRHPMYQPYTKTSLSWFHLRVFYVRISNILVDDLTPESLALNHIPLSPDTLLEMNGERCAIESEGMTSILRRNRVDKKSEEATYVSTDSIRFTGSVRFEVFDKDELILRGELEMENSNGYNGEIKSSRRWKMECESVMDANGGILKGKKVLNLQQIPPTIEVYVAGCFLEKPIILTKNIQLSYWKKQNRKGILHSIPEYDSLPENETMDTQSNDDSELDLRLARFRNLKPENDKEYKSIYWKGTDYMDGEDGELSWFNAGVKVGVGIGLGVCLGVGIGVGLLARTYTATTRNFRRQLG